MMNFLVGVIRRIFLFGFIAFLVLRVNHSFGQISRIDVDEASDIVYSSCSDNQFSIFIFRYPEIGQLEARYSTLLDQFSTQSSVFLVDIRMEPIPGCSRPKIFDLCGYETLNPYVKYKPFLGFIFTEGDSWYDFKSSPYYTMNRSFFLSITNKEGKRAPFVTVNSFQGFDILLDYLNKRPIQNYSQNKEVQIADKSENPPLDSAKVYRWILSMFEARKPVEKPVRGNLGFKASFLNGRLKPIGSVSPDSFYIEANVSQLTGMGLSFFYESPLGSSMRSIELKHRFEVGNQFITFNSQAHKGNWSLGKKIFNGVNLFTSYSIHSDFYFAPNLNFVLGAGGSLLGRLSYSAIDLNLLDPGLDETINKFDIGLFVSGGFRYLLNSQFCTLLDLGHNIGMLNFDKEEKNSINYRANMFSVSAGLLFSIR
jgi:hypothetical protein